MHTYVGGQYCPYVTCLSSVQVGLLGKNEGFFGHALIELSRIDFAKYFGAIPCGHPTTKYTNTYKKRLLLMCTTNTNHLLLNIQVVMVHHHLEKSPHVPLPQHNLGHLD